MKNAAQIFIFFIAIIFSLPVHADWLNVKNWNVNPTLNAKGDGITDDAPAIQQAIYSLTNGGTLYFPAGVYKLNSTVNTGSEFYQNYALWLTNQNVTIKGDGPGSVLLQTDCRTTLLIGYFNTTVAGLTIEDIKFQGDTNGPYYADNDPYASGKLLACWGVGKANGWSKYLRINRVCTNDQGKRNAIQIFGMDDVVIDSCRFIHFATTSGNMGPGFPSIWTTSEGLGSLHLVNNFFDGGLTTTNPAYGADGLLYEQNGEETIVSGNTINNFKLEGIQCGAVKQVISGNIFNPSPYQGAVSISITPQQQTNVQVTIANNIQNGGGMFLTDGDVSSETNLMIDAAIANNTVMLGDKESGEFGSIAVVLVHLERSTITGNTFDNYSDQGLVLNGNGKDDSSLLIQGNSLTSIANAPGSQTGMHFGDFRNITIMNNLISGGYNGSIAINDSSFPTNLPGRIVVGNNIYVSRDNATPGKWFRVGATTINTATTVTGGYNVTDLNPGPF